MHVIILNFVAAIHSRRPDDFRIVCKAKSGSIRPYENSKDRYCMVVFEFVCLTYYYFESNCEHILTVFHALFVRPFLIVLD